MEHLADNLIEDEAEQERLMAKPICFIVVGRPGVGKSTLATKLAETWRCILIDDTELLNTHIKNQTKQGKELLEILSEGGTLPEDMVLQLILARLNSPDVEHYGYVLSCLPFMSEDSMTIHEQIKLIKNLKMPPDIIINIKCADKDLVQRLSDLRQHPETGQLYLRELWNRDEVDNKGVIKDVDDAEDEEEQDGEEEPPKDRWEQMVWTPENSTKSASLRINMYKDTMLRPLEDFIADHAPLYLFELDGNNTPEELHLSVMSRLESMAVKRVSVPVCLHQSDDEELPDEIDPDELMRIMCSSKIMVPGFRWRRSRWGRTCPVALKEGKVIQGKPEYSVGFQDKVYILSSQEACQKFFTNPRPYLLPPMPRLPCRVSIIGPPQSGKSTLCKLLAQHYKAQVLDMEELMPSALAKHEQDRLDKIKEETTRITIEKIKMEMDDAQDLVTEDYPEVKAAVLTALEEAEHISIPPHDLYPEVLGKYIKEIEEMNRDAEVRSGWVLDNFPKNCSQVDILQKAGIMPDMVFCLKDADGSQVLKRLYEMNKESVDEAVKKRLQGERAEKESQALLNDEEQEAKPMEPQANLETVAEESDENADEADADNTLHSTIMKEEAVALPESWESGYTDGPEMNDYKQQLKECEAEWERMESTLTISHSVLEIGGKSPEDLLQEIVRQMEKPFKYVSWELSEADLQEEEEDNEALAELERAKEDSIDSAAAEEENEQNQEDTAPERLLGDARQFCPVALKEHEVLWPCSDDIAAKYREKIYYFSSTEARDCFIQNPEQYVAQTEPLKPPALRVFLLGARGSGKTAHGQWLARQLGLFHIQLREAFQELIMAKTKSRVLRADEVEPPEEPPEGLAAMTKDAGEEDEKKEDTDVNVLDMEQEVALTDGEAAIKAYLSDGVSLPQRILDMVVAPYWKQEPYKTTGFILEGFPCNVDEVQYMIQRQLFPDVVVTMEVAATDVQKRLLPPRLEMWRDRRVRYEAQLKLLHDMRRKMREEKMIKRRAELMAEYVKTSRPDDDDDDAGSVEGMDEDVEAMLQDEFSPEEDDNYMEDEETEKAAIGRLETEIEERFETDDNNLNNVTELLSEQNIPTVTINASGHQRVVRYQLLQKIQPLLTNRESLFQQCQPISYSLAWDLLRSCYKFHSAFGCYDPVKYKEGELIQPQQGPDTTYPLLFHQYMYFFASKENRDTFSLNPFKYLRQPKPTPCLPVSLAVIGPPKSGKTTVAQMFAQNYGLARLSIGSAMRMVLNKQGNTDLAVQMKKHLSQGLVVPDELAIMCLEVAVMRLVCCTSGYVLDGFPMTLKQAEMMNARSIIPMVVVELKVDTLEVLKRGLIDKLKPNKPHPMHDSSVILHIRNSCYKQELAQLRQHFQQQYKNWILLDGLKSKWWIWNCILEEVHVSVKYIQCYMERIRTGKAACIYRLCVSPKELHRQFGEFGQYCPVCLALRHHLVDCSESASLVHTAQYRGKYYRMCCTEHLEEFLSTPDQFVIPGCPYTLPPAHLLPRKLTEIQVKNTFPQQAEMRGFCPVTYLDGKQRYEALVRGNMEYAVEYRRRIYTFETKQKQDKFMRLPETYCDLRMPSKIPPMCEPIPLTSLPTLGYLEQGVTQAVIKAMTAVGCLKPKYPFLSVQRSALLYVAYYLKAFNYKEKEHTRQKYKKKLALFEENCALIPYLSSTMAGKYKPPSERSIEFEFKLHRFLTLGDLPGADGLL